MKLINHLEHAGLSLAFHPSISREQQLQVGYETSDLPVHHQTLKYDCTTLPRVLASTYSIWQSKHIPVHVTQYKHDSIKTLLTRSLVSATPKQSQSSDSRNLYFTPCCT